MKKYKYSEDAVTAEGLGALVDGYFAGTVKPFLKSADPPASNDEPVKVVVGTTFEEIVLDPSKDVLLEFYAPWCGHCKNLAPEFARAASKVKDDGVKFGAVDATAHASVASRFAVRGYPTLKVFRPDATTDAQADDYEGGRTAADLVRSPSFLVCSLV